MPPNGSNDTAAAEARLRTALLQNAENAQAWLELGDLLAQSRRFAEAEAAFKSSIVASPGTAAAYVQLAKLCLMSNRSAEAVDLLKRADAACQTGNPQAKVHVEALDLMARLKLLEGKVMEALPYLQAAVERGAGLSTKIAFASCLARVRFTGPRPDLAPRFAQMLHEVVVPPADLARSAISLLLAEPGLEQVFPSEEVLQPSQLFNPPAQRFASDVLLGALLTSTIVVDPDLERILTALRRELLLAVMGDEDAGALETDWLSFSSALACQCFINDYAFQCDDIETRSVDLLLERIASRLGVGVAPAALEVAILGCYRPLHSVSSAEVLLEAAWPRSLEQTITLQISMPQREAQLMASIPALTEISPGISDAVRRQYEESPYPRWLKVPRHPAKGRFQNIVRAALPPHVAEREVFADPARILIAGCGTGQESTGIALEFPHAEICAFDLSRPSLAYAARKAEEYGATNVKYVQGDLLNLDTTEKFDLVIAAGVLHHLEKPFDGLKVLGDVTRPGGHLMIALYSARGRQSLNAISDFAKDRGYGATPADLRKLRFEILKLGPSHPVRTQAIAWDDFFSLNMLKDMVFHVCEHRLTIPEIGAGLEAAGLGFRGFLVEPELRQSFLSRHGASADLLSLEQWDLFEHENPTIFSSMYHFMAKKPE
jgi:SAM-dependent methyltransferase/tetratricopeptide (TPR) repeat protein